MWFIRGLAWFIKRSDSRNQEKWKRVKEVVRVPGWIDLLVLDVVAVLRLHHMHMQHAKPHLGVFDSQWQSQKVEMSECVGSRLLSLIFEKEKLYSFGSRCTPARESATRKTRAQALLDSWSNHGRSLTSFNKFWPCCIQQTLLAYCIDFPAHCPFPPFR